MALLKINDMKTLIAERNATQTINYCPTGFIDVDYYLGGGLIRGQTYLLSSREGMGKTMLAINIAYKIASSGTGCVAYFSTKENSLNIMKRFCQKKERLFVDNEFELFENDSLLSEAGVDIDEFASHLNNVYMEDDPLLSRSVIWDDLNYITNSTNKKIDLIVIDIIELMNDFKHAASEYENGYEDAYRKYAESFKDWAEHFNCPILILMDIPQRIDKRTNHTPMLSDLCHNEFAMVLDNIIFLHRKDFYNKECDEKGIAEIIINKQLSSGKTGTILLSFSPKYQEFASL